jgi:hypothetical protein
LAITIVGLGGAFGGLLIIRQQAVDTTAEIARLQLRLEQHRKTITRMHAIVAEAVRPADLQLAKDRLGLEWQPIRYRFDPVQYEPATGLPWKDEPQFAVQPPNAVPGEELGG